MSTLAKLQILILQHPSEARRPQTTVPLCKKVLPHIEVKIGLSWKNLGKPNPKNWAVLYLGSGTALPVTNQDQIFEIVDKKAKTLLKDKTPDLAGLVLLDGTWAESKTMWWRNPWLLKLKRLALSPTKPSLFSKIKREPRRECLSTLEALAICLELISQNKTEADLLRAELETLTTSSGLSVIARR